jgi:hypothetical protein
MRLWILNNIKIISFYLKKKEKEKINLLTASDMSIDFLLRGIMYWDGLFCEEYCLYANPIYGYSISHKKLKQFKEWWSFTKNKKQRPNPIIYEKKKIVGFGMKPISKMELLNVFNHKFVDTGDYSSFQSYLVLFAYYLHVK